MKTLTKTYFYFITLPDRLYPFRNEIGGQWVRGRRSYEQAVDRALKRYGIGRLSYQLLLYRGAFHFIGSVLFIFFATVISQRLLGSETALYVLFCAAIAALSFQEFYMHPRQFGQHIQKGITDWLTWVVPMIAYLLLFIR